MIRGDLDWIVMKALEKNRARRYDTANGLALDIGRHLQNQPIEARSQSRLYRFQKLVRRNRVAVATVGAVVLALAVGLGVSTRLFFKERSAHQRADAAEREEARLFKEADTARANEASLRMQAEENEKKAQTEAARSAQVAQFMKNMLQGVGPGVAKGLDTQLLRNVLDQTAQQLNTSLKGQSEVEADLRMTLGHVYGDLDDWPDAEAMYRQAMHLHQEALGEEAPPVAVAMSNDARALDILGKRAEGIVMARQAVGMNRKLLGNDSLAVADSLNILGSILRRNIGTAAEKAESLPLLREALAIRRKQPGSDPLGLADTLTALGLAETRTEEGVACLREAMEIRKREMGEDNPSVANSMAHLGSALHMTGQFAEAETVQRQALAEQIKLLGPEHRDVITSHSSLGITLLDEKKWADAAAELQIAKDLQTKRPNWQNDADAVGRLSYLATALLKAGKSDEAEASYRDSLEKLKSVLPLNAPPVIRMLTNLTNLIENDGKADEARALIDANLEEMKAKFGPDDPGTLSLLTIRGHALELQGKLSDAEVQLRATADLWRKRSNWEAEPFAFDALYYLAGTLEREGKLADAEALYRQSLTSYQQALGPANSYPMSMVISLAGVLEEDGKADEARTLFEAYLSDVRSKVGPDNAGVLDLMNSAAWSCYLAGRPVEALPLAEESLKGTEKRLGLDKVGTLNVMDTVACVYEALERLDDAVPLFEKAVAGFKAATGADNQQTLSEMQKLGWVYQEVGRLTDAQQLLEETLRFQKAKSETDNPDVAQTLGELGLTLVREEKFAEAEPLLKQSLAIYEKQSPKNFLRFYCQSVMGAALVGEKKYADAEPLLLEGYNGLKQTENTIPGNRQRRLAEALERLVKCYTDWGKADDAAKWNTVLQAAKK